jgi:hypothetical protein
LHRLPEKTERFQRLSSLAGNCNVSSHSVLTKSQATNFAVIAAIACSSASQASNR